MLKTFCVKPPWSRFSIKLNSCSAFVVYLSLLQLAYNILIVLIVLHYLELIKLQLEHKVLYQFYVNFASWLATASTTKKQSTLITLVNITLVS